MNKVKNVINIKYYDSPCGGMIIGAVGKGLCLCDWRENRHRLHNDNRVKCFFNAVYEEKDSRLLDDALRELDEYFAGRRREFDIPLCPAGTNSPWRVTRLALVRERASTRSQAMIFPSRMMAARVQLR